MNHDHNAHHAEIRYLFWFALAGLAAYAATGYFPPPDSSLAHSLSNGLYGVALAAAGALFRAMGVSTPQTGPGSPPNDGLSPKLPGT